MCSERDWCPDGAGILTRDGVYDAYFMDLQCGSETSCDSYRTSCCFSCSLGQMPPNMHYILIMLCWLFPVMQKILPYLLVFGLQNNFIWCYCSIIWAHRNTLFKWKLFSDAAFVHVLQLKEPRSASSPFVSAAGRPVSAGLQRRSALIYTTAF